MKADSTWIPIESQKKRIQYYKNNPWARHSNYIRVRLSPSAKNEKRNACYQGIQNHLNAKDVKFLWLRDKAHELKRPSLDRIDSKGHYTLNNCRFIELAENISRGHKDRKKCFKGHELSGENLIITKMQRICRTCKKKWSLAYYYRNKLKIKLARADRYKAHRLKHNLVFKTKDEAIARSKELLGINE